MSINSPRVMGDRIEPACGCASFSFRRNVALSPGEGYRSDRVTFIP